ncbi:MAG: 50S ribosomal protein L4 [Bacteroidota bacterium]
MEATVYSIEGASTGRIAKLAEEVFSLENPNDHAIYQDVRSILANKRQGTSKAKERSEVRGSNKKPYRQKGTGNARAGHKRSPLRRHGGTVFGPRPRDYGFRLNKKLRKLARRSALTYKSREEGIKVVENFEFEAPKTKDFIQMLNSLEVGQKKVLLVLAEQSPNVVLSGRNLRKAQVIQATDLNTYDILNAETLLIQEGAVEIINQQLAN